MSRITSQQEDSYVTIGRPHDCASCALARSLARSLDSKDGMRLNICVKTGVNRPKVDRLRGWVMNLSSVPAYSSAIHSIRTLFPRLSESSAHALWAISQTKVSRQGEPLFSQGGKPEHMHLLCRGQVKVSAITAEGRSIIVKIAEPGTALGLAEVMAGCCYEGTAEPAHKCETLRFDRQQLCQLAAENNGLSLCLAIHLANECQRSYSTVKSLLGSRKVAARVARLLLQYAEGGNATPTASLRLTHEDIAELIGTSRESVTRILREFRRLRAVEVGHARLRISDPNVLHRLAAT